MYLDPRKPGKYCYNDLFFSFLYEPLYVGKGKNLQHLSHLKEAKQNLKCGNIYKCNVIRQIFRENKKPFILKIYENLTEEKAFNLEKKIISVIGRRDISTGSLTNLTDGGEGVSGRVVPEEERNRRREIQIKICQDPEEIKRRSERTKKLWTDPLQRKLRTEMQYDPRVQKIKSEATKKAHSKRYCVVFPNGQEEILLGGEEFRNFCKKFELGHEALQRVSTGKQTNHKGFKCYVLGKKEETEKSWMLHEENKLKNKEIAKKKLHDHFLGKKHSEETKRKIGEKSKGNKYALGYKHSKEGLKKISEASVRFWDNKRNCQSYNEQ